MAVIVFRGVKLDRRTAKMIQWAEKKAGFEFPITQGSYSTSVDASAGTHSQGGAADFSVKGLTKMDAGIMLLALKKAGFAAWHRVPAQGFSSEHIHAIAIGCPDLAPVAARQVVSYDKAKDGLKSNEDDKSYRPKPPVKFSLPLNMPVPRIPSK